MPRALFERAESTRRAAAEPPVSPTPAPGRLPEFDHVIASNEYGFYCVPKAYLGRTVPNVLREGRVYEPDTLALMRRKTGQGDVIAGGAFVGDFFPALSEALAPGRFLHTFEPNPTSHAAALYTMALNQLGNICLHQVAVGEETDTLHLQVRRDGEEMAAGTRITEEAQGDDSIAVPVRRLDDLVPAGRQISILQLDIEGHEMPALLGARRIVAENRPTLILEAAKPRRQRQFQRQLDTHFPKLGYRMAGTIERNCIFLPGD